MKTRYVLFFLLAIVFLTGCQKNRTVSIPAPDLQAKNTSQRLRVLSLKEELKEQEHLQAEIAELVKTIRDLKDVQQKLFTQMPMKHEKADTLLATNEAINLVRDVTFHNIANFKTTGFKKQRVHIQDGRIVETSRIWKQGNYRSTGNDLDMVIEGEGFFQILQPNGETAYTRGGNLHLDRDGNIVTSNGDKLDTQITIPVEKTRLTIGRDGTVSVNIAGQSQPQMVGRIELALFHNPSGLASIGRNLFVPTQASGDAIPGTPGENGHGTILAGFLEESNVNMLEEMMQLRMLQSWEKAVDQALMSIYE